MDWKRWTAIFIIAFIGTCGVISVDRQCMEITGKGGQVGLTLNKTAEGNVAFCFFGLEGEIHI